VKDRVGTRTELEAERRLETCAQGFELVVVVPAICTCQMSPVVARVTCGPLRDLAQLDFLGRLTPHCDGPRTRWCCGREAWAESFFVFVRTLLLQGDRSRRVLLKVHSQGLLQQQGAHWSLCDATASAGW